MSSPTQEVVAGVAVYRYEYTPEEGNPSGSYWTPGYLNLERNELHLGVPHSDHYLLVDEMLDAGNDTHWPYLKVNVSDHDPYNGRPPHVALTEDNLDWGTEAEIPDEITPAQLSPSHLAALRAVGGEVPVIFYPMDGTLPVTLEASAPHLSSLDKPVPPQRTADDAAPQLGL